MNSVDETENRLYESLSADEQQSLYDRAAWDYVNWLNGLTPEKRASEFKRTEWLDRWQPEAATRCPMCGDTVLELKWSADHIEWQCLEPTCRNNWEWKAR